MIDMKRIEYVSTATLQDGEQASSFLRPLRANMERRVRRAGYEPEWFYFDHTVETDYIGVRTLTMRAVPHGYARFELIAKQM